MRMTLHLLELKFICETNSLFYREEIYCWSSFLSEALDILRKRRQSSAKCFVILDLMQSGRSLMKVRNRSGSCTVPWGTPEMTFASDDKVPSNGTCYLCWLRRTHGAMVGTCDFFSNWQGQWQLAKQVLVRNALCLAMTLAESLRVNFSSDPINPWRVGATITQWDSHQCGYP